VDLLHHGETLPSHMTIPAVVGSLLQGLSLRIIDEAGNEWDNAEGCSVTVDVREEGGVGVSTTAHRSGKTAQRQRQRQREGEESTPGALAALALPEVIEVGCAGSRGQGRGVPLEFSVTCTIAGGESAMEEQHFENTFFVNLQPDEAERWKILLAEVPNERGSTSLSVHCDDEEDLAAQITGERCTALHCTAYVSD
jgi:hypothetical protein